MVTTTAPLLAVAGLTVTYRGRRGQEVAAVQDVNLTVAAGETVALVGESGSGKSTTALAVTGLLPAAARVTAGRIGFRGEDLQGLRPRARRTLLGTGIGLVPQDPTVSLNPVQRIGDQVAEVLRVHHLADRTQAGPAAVAALAAAGIDRPELRARQYPHELSGGMRQRVLIAIALVGRPALLVADEPTSALDVTVQRRILDSIAELVDTSGSGLLLVTHDLGVAGDRADRIVVMSGGRIVEDDTAAAVLRRPRHPYTRSLIAAAPSLRAATGPAPARAVTASPPRPVLQVTDLVRDFPIPGAGRATTRAVDGVSFTLGVGRTLGLVGESGSGKSTTARLALRLLPPTSGTVVFDGTDITGLSAGRLRAVRRRFQLVQQNPYGSLNPRLTVGQVIADPLRSYGVDRRTAGRRVDELVDRVGLPADFVHRRPDELSGGQRQRVAIARALALGPELVALDEPVSALDVRVQAQILDLLARLQADLGVAYLFISHDLAVVREIAHEVAVLQHGRIVETGATADVFTHPTQDYTRQLLDAVPGRRLGVG